MKYDQRDEISQGVVWSVQTTFTLDPKILYDLLVKFAILVYLFWYTYKLFSIQSDSLLLIVV